MEVTIEAFLNTEYYLSTVWSVTQLEICLSHTWSGFLTPFNFCLNVPFACSPNKRLYEICVHKSEDRNTPFNGSGDLTAYTHLRTALFYIQKSNSPVHYNGGQVTASLKNQKSGRLRTGYCNLFCTSEHSSLKGIFWHTESVCSRD